MCPVSLPRVVLAQQVNLKYRANNVSRRTNRLRRRRAERKAPYARYSARGNTNSFVCFDSTYDMPSRFYTKTKQSVTSAKFDTHP